MEENRTDGIKITESDNQVTGTDTGANSSGSERKRGRPRKDNTRDTANNHAGNSTAQKVPTDGDLERIEPETVSIFLPPEDTTKPKKKKQKKSSITTKDNLRNVFSLISNFAGSIWELSDEECEQLAEPIDSILQRYDYLEKLSKYGDVTALLLTSLVVFTPRVMLTMEQVKSERKKKEVKNIEYEEKQVKRASTTNNSSDSSDVPSDFKKYIHAISG